MRSLHVPLSLLAASSWLVSAACGSPSQSSSSSGAAPRATVAAAEASHTTGSSQDRTGFTTEVVDGRLWVFRADEVSEPSEKHITLVGAGPDGMTLKAPDRETALAWMAATPGFQTLVDDGRIWVFRDGAEAVPSDEHVIRVGVGPLGATVKAPDRGTLDAYLAEVGT